MSTQHSEYVVDIEHCSQKQLIINFINDHPDMELIDSLDENIHLVAMPEAEYKFLSKCHPGIIIEVNEMYGQLVLGY